MSLLRFIKENPGSTISEISAYTGVSKATVSRLVKKLESKGLVKTVMKGRNKHVYLNDSKELPKELTIGIIRATEYLFIPFLVKEMKNLGFDVNIRIYNEGLTLTRHLSMGLIDLAYSPLITQLLNYPFNPTYKIFYGGVYGGAGILRNPKVQRDSAASTPISTMETCVRLYDKNLRITYYYSGNEILNALLSSKVSFGALWEPYLSYGISKGLKVVADCSELVSPYCCTLGISKIILEEYGDKLYHIIEKAFENYRKNPFRMSSWYSRITKIPVSLLKKTQKSYKISGPIDRHSVERLIDRLDIGIPNKSVLMDAINLD